MLFEWLLWLDWKVDSSEKPDYKKIFTAISCLVLLGLRGRGIEEVWIKQNIPDL